MNVLSTQQRSTLASICRTFCPRVSGASGGVFNNEIDTQKAVAHLEQRLGLASETSRHDFANLLSRIEHPYICWLYTRQFKPFSKLNQPGREQVLRSWATNRLPILNRILDIRRKQTRIVNIAYRMPPGTTQAETN